MRNGWGGNFRMEPKADDSQVILYPGRCHRQPLKGKQIHSASIDERIKEIKKKKKMKKNFEK